MKLSIQSLPHGGVIIFAMDAEGDEVPDAAFTTYQEGVEYMKKKLEPKGRS